MTTDPIINNVDEEFSLQLTKLIKNYVLDLVNHEVDVITDSDWFEEKIKTTMEEIRKWKKKKHTQSYGECVLLLTM